MKKLLATALLSLVVLGLGEHRASAFFFGCGQCCKPCCSPCCGPCCIPCCNAQHNAFSPTCLGVLVKRFFGLRKCCSPADLAPPPCCPPPCPADPCCGAPGAPAALPPAGHAGMMGMPYGMARGNGYQPAY